MKESTKHIRAAKRIVNGTSSWCCSALTQERQDMTTFRKIFKPDHLSNDKLWFDRPDFEENQLTRSLALLFTAEVLKAEGK